MTNFSVYRLDSALAFSNEHNVLVWTLNFYIIESTSKYIPDCEMVTNTIISANNVLKRTASLALYSCIIHVSAAHILLVTFCIKRRKTFNKRSLFLKLGIGTGHYLEDNYPIFS